MRKERIHVPHVMNEAYDYTKPATFSRGMSIDIGTARIIFVSGTASIGTEGQTLYAGDFKAQVLRTYENIRAVLNDSRADWEDVVKITIYLKNISKYYELFNEIRCEYFKKIDLIAYPTSTCVEANLCREDLLVEMDLIAMVKK